MVPLNNFWDQNDSSLIMLVIILAYAEYCNKTNESTIYDQIISIKLYSIELSSPHRRCPSGQTLTGIVFFSCLRRPGPQPCGQGRRTSARKRLPSRTIRALRSGHIRPSQIFTGLRPVPPGLSPVSTGLRPVSAKTAGATSAHGPLHPQRAAEPATTQQTGRTP